MAITEPRFCTSRQLGEMLDPASGTLPLFSRQTILDELHSRALVSELPPHLAEMANENGDVQFVCPRCDWFAQVPADAQGVFLHQLSDARVGHVAIAHPDLWAQWRSERD